MPRLLFDVIYGVSGNADWNIFYMSVFNRGSPEEYRKGEWSTAEKFYDLEESQRRYQELLEENIWLKQQIERNRPQ